MNFAIDRVEKGVSEKMLFCGDYSETLPLDTRTMMEFLSERLDRRIGTLKWISIGHSTSTFEDAQRLRAFLQLPENASGTVLITTDCYNMWRVRWIFSRILKNDIQRACFAQTPEKFTNLDPKTWWKREKDFLYVFNEILKGIYYLFKY